MSEIDNDINYAAWKDKAAMIADQIDSMISLAEVVRGRLDGNYQTDETEKRFLKSGLDLNEWIDGMHFNMQQVADFTDDKARSFINNYEKACAEKA